MGLESFCRADAPVPSDASLFAGLVSERARPISAVDDAWSHHFRKNSIRSYATCAALRQWPSPNCCPERRGRFGGYGE